MSFEVQRQTVRCCLHCNIFLEKAHEKSKWSDLQIRMRNWHITWFLNKHLSWVLKRTVSPFRWDSSFDHPKHMFELESHSKHSLILSASCRSSKFGSFPFHVQMSTERYITCQWVSSVFFLNACWSCADPEGVQLWQCLLFFFCFF